MSASTVSIRAANTTNRRRSVLNSTAASSVELLELETTTTINNANKSGNRGQENGDVVLGGGGGGGGDGIANKVKKSSSLLLERSRDGAVQVKDLGLRDAVVSPRRSGKKVSGSKAVKPWWLTVLSVFVKNFMLLLVVLGFVQFIYRLAVRSSGGVDVGIGTGSGEEALVELEGRLAEMEKTWKKTAKLMQVQVEVVDRKVGNEVAGLKEELSKRIEEKSVFLGNELRKLDGKIESLETALGQLSLDEFLTREEFERFYENLKKMASGDKELSLDEVRAYAKEVVKKEIEKHAADGLGMVDYALASGGGLVVKHSEPFRVGKWGWTKKSVLNAVAVHDEAMRILRPSFGEPGQCFPLKGSNGFVQIRLRAAIVPEAITLEHVAKSVAYDQSSAPKNCRVYGWLQGPEPSPQVNVENMTLLSEFTYDLDKSSAQTFPVSDSASGALVNMVRLDIFSNHGSASHTCIYRLRVHGQEPTIVPAPQAVAP